MADRLAIPIEIERSVKVEAGHRCAIPTCRQTPVEIAHIEPYSKVKVHTFDNLIALCPMCHTRFDKGEIDRKAMRQYNANLALLNSRYSDLERRILEEFAENPDMEAIRLPFVLEPLYKYLVKDGIIKYTSVVATGGMLIGDLTDNIYVLTEKGREFISNWTKAKGLD